METVSPERIVNKCNLIDYIILVSCLWGLISLSPSVIFSLEGGFSKYTHGSKLLIAQIATLLTSELC